jgi:CO/xanthine dehydrogenase Mo-binding subunit
LDRVGRALGLDPLTIRERNVVEAGDKLATGQILDPSTAARECLEEAAQRTDFKRRWQELEEGRERGDSQKAQKGIGISLFFHGAGFTGNGERKMRSPVTVRLLADGRLELLTANTEMGQGQATVFPQIAAAAGGLTLNDVVLARPDTAQVPDSGPTVASRTTMVVGGTLAQATSELVRQVLELWSTGQGETRRPEVAGGTVRLDGGKTLPFRQVARQVYEVQGEQAVTLRHEPPDWQEFDEATYRGAAYPTYGWGADVVEVDVDPHVLEVRATRATAVCDVGRVIHPGLCLGQVEGGTLQSLGYALCEEIKTEHGRYLNDRLATYIIPTAKDSPIIDAVLLEHPWAGGPFGAKGVGELPMSGGAPATLQAIENATGIALEALPATPEALLQALSQGRAGR